MTTDHTPGPWTVEDDFTIMADVGAHICTVNEPDDFPCLDQDEANQAHVLAECQANARLIAAAPTMLAALTAVHTMVGAYALSLWRGGNVLDAQRAEAVETLVKAAIAHAEGREG